MSLSGTKGRLVTTARDLSIRWEETKYYWSDARSQEFDRRYMQELFVGVDKAATIIGKLDELLNKVRKDCE